ncbi:caspase family protein [Reichenbachiella agarivorans]|uniref:Caspase family protein n=1 Tax=Reichenbachiella agarivorans TaxID=2979464 RepID=A0ABY6CUC0_9BACT|nr:caspase family protein [Reichenbachiella agarivorans]UXP34115.1 caspase family protein [Reichenbachiella agarivorans]
MRVTTLVLSILLIAYSTHAQKLIIDNQGHSGLIHGLSFIDHGKKLLSISEDKTVRVWDVADGSLHQTYRFERQDGVNGKIYASALSKDKKFLFLGGYFDNQEGDKESIGEIRVIDLANNRLLTSLKGHQNVVLDMVISQDGSKLVSASADQSIIVWDISSIQNGRLASVLTTIPNIDNVINTIDISRDGKYIAVGDNQGYVKTWTITGTNPSKFKIHEKSVRKVKYGDYQLLSAGEDGQIVKWTLNGKFNGTLAQLPGAINVLEISPDNQYLTAMGRVGIVFKLSDESIISRFDYHTNAVSSITTAPFESFDEATGIYIASAGGDDKNILIWEAKSGKLVRNLVGSGKSVFGVGVDEKLKTIGFSQSNPTGNLDDVVLEKAFDLNQLLLMRSIESVDNFHTATIQYKGLYLSKESSNSIKFGENIIATDELKDGTVRSYSFINDGQAVVIGSSYTLSKYTLSGEKLGNYMGHEGEVWAVSDFAQQGLVVSGSNDQTIKIWNNVTGENLFTLFISVDNEWVIWTPQGFYEASAGGEKYIGWHINKGRNKLAEFHDVSAFSKFYHRPDVIKETLRLKSYEKVAEALSLNAKPEEKITPPTIAWLTKPGTVVNGVEATINFQITSQDPVTQIKLLVNGRPIISKSELKISGNGQAEKVSLEVKMPEGSNGEYAFSVFAADKTSKIVSTEMAVTFKNETIQSKSVQTTASTERSKVTLDPINKKITKSNLYMVSIGVSEFANASYDLRYADDDANAIDEMFKAQKGKMYNSVTSIKLTNKDATRAKILNTFQRLETYTTVDDFVIIFIASHGMNVDDNFYIIPHDGDANNPRISCIDWRDFSDLVGNMSAKVVLFIDTCHSGQLGNNIGQKKLSNTEAVRQLAGKEYGVVIMAAATGYEYSLEHPDWGHGAFTLSILEGINDGKADIKPDGVVHLRELDYYLSERVQELTGGRQHPTTQKPSSISKLSLAEIN